MAAVSGKKDMKPDLPIIGQNSPTNQGWSLFKDLFRRETEKIDENAKAIKDRIKIHELRKSCGVEDSEKATINIRRPPRYRYLDKS